jgi:hypothetical protein
MTNKELFSLPILLPSTAKVGRYSNGKAYKTLWGMIYTFELQDSTTFRISKSGLLQLHTPNGKYADILDTSGGTTYRVKKGFTIWKIADNALFVDEILIKPTK